MTGFERGASVIPPPSPDLGSLIDRARIAVVIGAGGVGKTTVAAAMAARAARDGRKVACLTIDPARRLADSLGVPMRESSGELIDVTARLASPLRPGGRLEFGMLNPMETFRAFVRRRASTPEKAERILKNRLYRYLAGSLSGLQEYMALEKLSEIRGDRDVDLIVLDTPPTANAVDFFTAPGRMVGALDGELVRWMSRACSGPGRLGFDLAGRLAGGALEAMGRVAGAELLGEIIGFVEALSDLFGSFAERAAEVERVLAGDDVAFCLVTTADRDTLRESRELRLRLQGMGLAVHGVVFNRVHRPRVPPPPAHADPRLVSLLEPLGREWNQRHDRETELMELVLRGWEELEAATVVPLMPAGAARVEALDLMGGLLAGAPIADRLRDAPGRDPRRGAAPRRRSP